MKNTKKYDLNLELAADEITTVAGGYDGAYADEESEYYSHSPFADNGEVARSATPAVPASRRRRVRRFREITVNGKKKLLGYWVFAD